MSDIALLDEAIDRFLEDIPPATTDNHQFWGAQFDAGLAWVHFPVGYGGLGLNPKLAEQLDSRLAAAGVPRNTNVNFMLVGMAGRRSWPMGHLRSRSSGSCGRSSRGEEIWCQLFSEPGAGSDLAGLVDHAPCATATSGCSTARRCGRRSRTSRAGRWCSCRTDPDSRSTRASRTS